MIAQINRLKGSLCVTAFKILLALREDGALSSISVLVVCSPYFVAAALRLALHFAKCPIAPADGSPGRALRPGTPFNPVHPVILLLACRADGLNAVSWTATFWPVWTVFALLGLASIVATVLAIGILAARDPPDRGQRALFFLCYAFLITVTSTGFTFLVRGAPKSIPLPLRLRILVAVFALLQCRSLSLFLSFHFAPPFPMLASYSPRTTRVIPIPRLSSASPVHYARHRRDRPWPTAARTVGHELACSDAVPGVPSLHRSL